MVRVLMRHKNRIDILDRYTKTGQAIDDLLPRQTNIDQKIARRRFDQQTISMAATR